MRAGCPYSFVGIWEHVCSSLGTFLCLLALTCGDDFSVHDLSHSDGTLFVLTLPLDRCRLSVTFFSLPSQCLKSGSECRDEMLRYK